MIDEEIMEKVLQAMEHCDLCSDMPNCQECFYLREPNCMDHLKRDIIALLKAQEPVEPTWRRGLAFCGSCSRQFCHGFKYCPECGRPVKWA